MPAARDFLRRLLESVLPASPKDFKDGRLYLRPRRADALRPVLKRLNDGFYIRPAVRADTIYLCSEPGHVLLNANSSYLHRIDYLRLSAFGLEINR